MPVVLTIIGDLFTLEERAKIQGYFSAVWGTSSLAGPALGALLVHTMGWRSVFFVNLPFAVIGFVVLAWKYHDHEKPHSTDLDLPGVTLLAIGCAALLALVSRLGPGGWPWPVSLGLFVITVLALGLFVRVEFRASNPILPPGLMIQRAIGPSLIGSLLLGVGFLSLDTYVPLYVQGALGGGATAAAAGVPPVMLSWATTGRVAAPLIVPWGFRRTAVIGCILTLASFTGLFLCALAGSPKWVITSVLLMSGFGFGMASMPYLLAAQEAVDWQQRGIITSGVSFFRTMGGSVGIGVLGMLFNVLVVPRLGQLRAAGINPADLMDPHSRASLPPDSLRTASGAIALGLTWVFAAMVIAAAAQLAVTVLLPSRKATRAAHASDALEAMGA
jgi:MFS family permease